MIFSPRKLQSLKAAKQKGFTLVELAIVGLFLGILVVYAVSRFTSGGVDTQRAGALDDIATKVADTWSTLQNSCNASADISAASLASVSTPSIAKANLSLLLGTAAPSTANTPCYSSSGIRPLSALAIGAQGAEVTPSGYGYGTPVYTTGTSGNAVLKVVFTGVPDNVALALYRKYSTVSTAAAATAMPATADTTDPKIQFSTATAGKRDVSLLKPL